MRAVLHNGCLVTMNRQFDLVEGGLLVEDGRIAALLAQDDDLPDADVRIDLHGHVLVPGFVQSHVHCCQTLFRGAADDLLLLDWLRQRIWPLEAAHDPETLATSARLTATELLLGGTTAFLSMETVHHTEAVLAALGEIPIRAVIGKCLMDEGDAVPAGLRQDTSAGLEEALELAVRYPATAGARLRTCLAPRFALCCSRSLLEEVARISRETGLLVHTHACEQKEEVALVKSQTGFSNLEYFDHIGLLEDRLRVAHAVHLADGEDRLLIRSGAHVLHCPSSNLKLGSGIAPITRYLEQGVPVSVGADGAPCNNNLDALREARLAALLQKPVFGPQALPARTALSLITINGARSLGMEQEIGSIEVGKRADLVEFDLDRPHIQPGGDVYSRLIYAAERSDIRRVFVDGAPVVEQDEVTGIDRVALLARSREALDRLLVRTGLAAR